MGGSKPSQVPEVQRIFKNNTVFVKKIGAKVRVWASFRPAYEIDATDKDPRLHQIKDAGELYELATEIGTKVEGWTL